MRVIDVSDAEKILSVNGLCVSYNGVLTVQNISFELCAGQSLGIIGESGCGKSTLLKAIMRLDEKTEVSGKVVFNGRDMKSFDEKELIALRGADMAMVSQNASLSLDPVKTVSSLFYETAKAHNKIAKKTDCNKKAAQIMEKLMLKDSRRILRSFPFELSGGMCQRVAIALAMINSPKLILADEPTSALDVASQLQVLDELGLLKDEFGVSVVMVSHNIGVVKRLCEKTAVMYAGRIVEYGNTREILINPLHPYTRALMAAIPDMDGNISKGLDGTPPAFTKKMPGCPFAPRCSMAFDRCKNEEPQDLFISREHSAKCFALENMG